MLFIYKYLHFPIYISLLNSFLYSPPLNHNLNDKLPSNIRFLTEGSGADTKYYIQAGADAASKKLLGRELDSFYTNMNSSVWVNVSLPINDAKVVIVQTDWGTSYSHGAAVVNMLSKTCIVGAVSNNLDVRYINESTISVRIVHGTGATIFYI